jgi:hypothetical protein
MKNLTKTCTICKIPATKEAIYRNSPKGTIPADWRCWKHLDDRFKEKAMTHKQFLINAGLENPND